MRSVETLVQADAGLVSREIFASDEIYRMELERIFSRAWLFVGHESLVPKPDDYFVSRMGGESVILTRDRQGRIQVMLNSCAHRGMKLCRYDHGNNRTFTCPYHGWSFSTDGKLVERPGELVGVPGHATHYKGELDKKAWGLKTVAQVCNYKGAIFATWDPAAPPFEDYLGDMRLYLDAALDHRDGSEGGSEVIGGVQKWRVKCNWKFAPENFIGDRHHDISHRSVDLVGIGPSAGKGRRDFTEGRVCVAFPDLGHGSIGRLPAFEEPPFKSQFQNHPVAEAYFRKVYDARVARLGDSLRVTPHAVGTIFPNMSFHAHQPRSLAVFHPISGTEMEMWRMYLIDKDAPEEVKEAARHYYLRYSGPGGLTESDDMENWTGATEACVGTESQKLYFNYQMGIGHVQPVPHITGAVHGEYSEENARAFYRRWGQFMGGADWDALMPGAVPPRAARVG
ncbi:aromatic ring-hydroxylating oxygenase subunit alpha [Bordetella flabilis]|uniref:Hydrogenase n=1 Tax=Bordetella flabilis TaxID=463014 RepID=A0A193GJL2_9BORD|nr:aromatic ring-hydroxylating dioxygenase subunit alpha [Bordetella flabilis]ANN79454.1 hydrogenase [Bordetella flabilis]